MSRWVARQAIVNLTEQNARLLRPFLLEFWHLPAPFTSEAAPVTLAKVARRVTVFLTNGAFGYSHTHVFSHMVTPSYTAIM